MDPETEIVEQPEGGVDWGAEVDSDLNDDLTPSDSFSEDDASEAAAAEPAPAEEAPAAEEPASEPAGDDPTPDPAPEEGQPKEGEGESETPTPEDKKPAEEAKTDEESAAPAEAPKEDQTPSYEELETRALSELEKFYALSEDDQQLLENEPATALPKMAAKIHLRAVNSVMQAVSTMLPQAISHHGQLVGQFQSLETKFFESHPELKGVDQTAVVQSIRAYRAANPKADVEQVIQGAGALAKIQLKIAPAAQAAPTPKPHVPAQPGAATPAPQVKSKDENPWAQEFDEDIEE